MEIINQQACFGGVQGIYRHNAATIGLPMRFSVFQPPQARLGPVPALFFLAGLTCNEETFMIKGNAQRAAAEAGIMLIAPDTSPRQTGIEGAAAQWDLGDGAGFYLDATEAPWARHFKMESYLIDELYPLIVDRFAVRADAIGISGHSMGGHGALTLALRHPQRFRSVSAFAPIAAPTHCPWGEKAFTTYLGTDRKRWKEHDASALMAEARTPFPAGILIDQGLADQFLPNQLLPERFEAACRAAEQPLTVRRHPGYEHGYYFVSTFMADHLAFHRQCLVQ